MTQLPDTIGNVREVDITDEMQTAYLDYAMSVIVSRALPDVRDGLKPVHRRILYAMHDMGLLASRPYKKSARIVGEVLGKYHPHGDTAVYDAMVRMAQDFSLRYPLVDGQGNFGSIDGDNAAAMRYTEARLDQISNLMLSDLEKDTVEWTDNFDNSLKEPTVLPATLPNLLINGANGIAVGMSTNIPPHNLGEVVDALIYMLNNYASIDEIGLDDLLKFIKGPDFPTGGIAYRYRKDRRGKETNDVIVQGYSTGRGRLIIQAKAHFEQLSRGRTRIVITELPYQTNKTNLLERIATLVRDGKIEGITDMRDESDRAGMRIVIDLTRTVEPKSVLADLFKYTPMQQTFGMSMLALVDGEPRMLSLKRMLQLFLEHREEVIRRRSEYDLARARERAHIVEGLLKALDIMDEVIDTIRRSQRVDTARNNLMKNFEFTQVQAQAILDMPLKRLAALERRRLQDEYKELSKLIDYLEGLLADAQKIRDVIKTDLLDLREKYADGRRTQIVDRTKGTLTVTDLLPDQKVWVSLGTGGEVRRQAFTTVTKTSLRQTGRDSAAALITANTRDYLYLFNRNGHFQRIAINEIPENQGKHLAEFTEFTRRDTVRAALPLPRLSGDEATGYLFMVTDGGTVKRVTLADFVGATPGSTEAMRVDDKESLGWVFLTPGEQEVILISAKGKSIRFSEEDVRAMGLTAGGVAGMKLSKGDRVVGACLIDAEGELITVTSGGYTKRTSLIEYSSQGRNGSGVIAHKTSKRTGDLVNGLVINPENRDLIVYITEKGIAKPMDLDEVPNLGRATQGQELVTSARGDQVEAVKVAATVPGFVDDDTLTPPAAETNGRSGKSSDKSSSQKAPDKAASNGSPKKASKPASASKTSTSKNATRKKPASKASSTQEADTEAGDTEVGDTEVGDTEETPSKPASSEKEPAEKAKKSTAKSKPKKAADKPSPKPESKPEPEPADPSPETIQPSLLADADAPPAKSKKSKVARVSSVTKSQRKKKK